MKPTQFTPVMQPCSDCDVVLSPPLAVAPSKDNSRACNLSLTSAIVMLFTTMLRSDEVLLSRSGGVAKEQTPGVSTGA